MSTTGEYVWHYQMVPDEQWDFTCTQPMILADLNIDGQPRTGDHAGAEERLLLRAGSRQTGKLISAKTYVPNLWATEIDLKTGRPIVNPGAYVTETPRADDADLDGRAQLASDVVTARSPGLCISRRRSSGTCRPAWRTSSSASCRSAPTAGISLHQPARSGAASCRRSPTVARRATCWPGIR